MPELTYWHGQLIALCHIIARAMSTGADTSINENDTTCQIEDKNNSAQSTIGPCPLDFSRQH